MDKVTGTEKPARWRVIDGGPVGHGRPRGTHHAGEIPNEAEVGAGAADRWLPPRLVIIDIDDPARGGPRLSGPELRAANEAVHRGIAIAVASAYAPEEAASAFDGIEMAPPPVIQLNPDIESAAAPSPIDAAAQMANIIHMAHVTLPRVAVVAATPLDLPLILEAGRAFALAGAGRRCRAAADALFPARAQGGLAQALALIATARG